MTTVIKTKNSTTTTSAPSSLAQGELAVNITDKKLWVGNASSTPVQIAGNGFSPSYVDLTVSNNLTLSGGTANGVLYLNGSKVATSGSALVFDGTHLLVGTTTSNGAMVEAAVSASASYQLAANFTNSTNANFQIKIANSISGIGTSTNTPLAFLINSTEVMRADTAGNLGLGVTPSAWGAGKAIEVGALGNGLWGAGTANTLVTTNAYYNGAAWKYANTGYASYYQQELGTHKWFNAASGTGGATVSFTQAMTLGASGSLGVGDGATNPDSTVSSATGGKGLVIGGTAGGYLPTLILTKTGSSGGARTWAQYVTNDANGSYVFYDATASAERMRIDSFGNLLVGTTSTSLSNSNSFFVNTVSGAIAVQHLSGSSSGAQYAYFAYNGSGIGSITQNGTTGVLYNIVSDYRLKDVVGAISDSGSRIDAVQPINYTMKADGSAHRGFLAHQFQEVYPNSVSGEKDAVDEKGEPILQGMQAGSAEAMADIFAELQSLRKRVAQLEGK